MSKMVFTSAYVLSGPGVVATVRLKARHAFLMIMRGSKPESVPITDPGTYEIDALNISAKPGAVVWPVIIMSVRRKHVPMWEASPQPMIDALVDDAIVQSRSASIQ